MITVFIISDYLAVRTGIKFLLASAPDISVVGEASDYEGAVEGCRNLNPDIVIADICLTRDQNSLRFMREVVPTLSGTRVVMLMSSTSRDHVDQALQHGAMGYLTHASLSEKRLVEAVRSVAAGQSAVDEPVTALLDKDDTLIADESLTRRENEVLMLVAKGLTNKQIADKLKIDHKTVRNHLNSVYCKLSLKSRLEAAMFVRDKFAGTRDRGWVWDARSTWASVLVLFCICQG